MNRRIMIMIIIAFCFFNLWNSRNENISLGLLFGFGLFAQDNLEEIVTWELEEGTQFRCRNLNSGGSDLNNDGYDDYIHWNPGDPYTFQFFMGSAVPDTIFDFEIEVPFGSSDISWGGDLNGDGYKDIIYTVCTDWGDPGDIYICLCSDNIDLEPELILQGEDYAPDPYHLGFTGTNAGYDFNGDGYNDILAGGTGDDYTWRGMVAIFLGGEDLDSEADFHLLGSNLNQLGKYKTAGDINGDGYDDLIISRNIEFEEAILYEIYLGDNNIDTSLDFEIEEIYGSWWDNPDLSGDLNNDGFFDLIIPTFEINIYFGNPNGYLTLNQIITHNYDITNLSYININGDEFSDLLVKVGNDENLYVYFGNENFDLEPDILFPISNLQILPDESSIVCNIGDFNNDAKDEILINDSENGFLSNSATLFRLHGGSEIDNYEIKIPNYKLTNYPNPFNPITTISYDLPVNKANLVIEIFNIKGERIRTLCAFPNGSLGTRSVVWDGTDNYQNHVSSGVYLYRIKTEEGVLISKKMLLLK